MATQPKSVERIFERLVDAAPDAIVVIDADGTIQLANREVEELFWYTRDRLIGAPVEMLMPERFRALHGSRRVLWAEQPASRTLGEGLDLTGLRSDGTEFAVEIRVSPFETEAGLYAVGVVRDATHARRAKEQRLKLVHDLGERVKELTALHQTARLLHEGREPSVLLSEIVKLLPSAWQYPEIAEVRIVYQDIDVQTASFAAGVATQRADFTTAMGGCGFIEVVYREGRPAEVEGPFLAEERSLLNSLAELLGIYFDRLAAENERLRLQAAQRGAEEGSRAKDEFLAMVSHELRSPLNVMLGWIRMIRGGQLDESTAARGMEILERNIKLQAKLIEDLLDLSRIAAGKLTLEQRTLDLGELIGFAVDASRPAADAKGVQLEAFLQPVGRVTADQQRLQQVIFNLVTNAVKFTPQGGRIDVRLEPSGEMAHLTVSDSGVGIGQDVLPHVFERFRQGDASVTRQHGGLGLGLAIARHVVEMHGGSISAASAGPGAGATFTVTLPLETGTLEAERPAPSIRVEVNRSLLSSVRVLIIDDQRDERTTLSTILQQYGADTIEANSATAALDLLPRSHPDIIVCDIAMPGEDGLSFIRKFRHLWGDAVPAAALTGHASQHGRRLALEAGFQTYLNKPVDPAALAVAIAALVDRTPTT
jgi:PAS domain S-box-containing protein